MALAPDSITIADAASGLEHAGKNVSSKFHPAGMWCDADGHLVGTAPSYLIYQAPRVTTAAATDFLDFFNASGSGKILRFRGIWPAIQITAASAIVPSFQFDVIRTSAVGTGGSTIAEASTAPSAGAGRLSRPSTRIAPALPAQVTARTLPTGGATAAGWYFSIWLLSEEVNAATYQLQATNFLPQPQSAFELEEGQGFKIRQTTATASTGTNFGWLLSFEAVP